MKFDLNKMVFELHVMSVDDEKLVVFLALF